MKALSSFPNFTTSSLAAPDSDLGTITEWNMLAEHRGDYVHIFHRHEVMIKLKDTKWCIIPAEAKNEIPPKAKRERQKGILI